MINFITRSDVKNYSLKRAEYAEYVNKSNLNKKLAITCC